MLTHLAMFAMCLVIDYVYVMWVYHSSRREPLRAATYSVLCVLFGQASTILCVKDWWLLAPACAGHALGTIIAIYHGDSSHEQH